MDIGQIEHPMNTTPLTNSNQIFAILAVLFAVVCEFLQNAGVIRRGVQAYVVCFAPVLK